MNKFKAMSKVLNTKICRRNPNNTEWSFVFKRMVFCTISKSNGKYFVHYEGRKTSLCSYSTFMAAAAVAADLYCRLYNSNAIAGGTEFFNNSVLIAYLGTDGHVYTRSPGHFNVIEVHGNTYNHLTRNYANVLASDAERGILADTLDDCVKELLSTEE